MERTIMNFLYGRGYDDQMGCLVRVGFFFFFNSQDCLLSLGILLKACTMYHRRDFLTGHSHAYCTLRGLSKQQ